MFETRFTMPSGEWKCKEFMGDLIALTLAGQGERSREEERSKVP